MIPNLSPDTICHHTVDALEPILVYHVSFPSHARWQRLQQPRVLGKDNVEWILHWPAIEMEHERKIILLVMDISLPSCSLWTTSRGSSSEKEVDAQERQRKNNLQSFSTLNSNTSWGSPTFLPLGSTDTLYLFNIFLKFCFSLTSSSWFFQFQFIEL